MPPAGADAKLAPPGFTRLRAGSAQEQDALVARLAEVLERGRR